MKEYEAMIKLLIPTYLTIESRYQKGIDYVIQGRQIIPIDEFTGRLLKEHRFSLFIHQLLELKENLKVGGHEHLMTLPLPTFFDCYGKKAGMTGTIDFPVARDELSRMLRH